MSNDWMEKSQGSGTLLLPEEGILKSGWGSGRKGKEVAEKESAGRK